MKTIAGGLALAAALAAAVLIHPPRAVPALSPTAAASACPPRCHGERRSRHAVVGRGAKRRRPGTSHRRTRAAPAVVDVNRADVATLERVPGISEELARRIVAFRALSGPLESLDDLSDLDGLSESRIMTLSRYLVVR